MRTWGLTYFALWYFFLKVDIGTRTFVEDKKGTEAGKDDVIQLGYPWEGVYFFTEELEHSYVGSGTMLKASCV